MVLMSQAPCHTPAPVTASGLQVTEKVEVHLLQQQTSSSYLHSCEPGETQRWLEEGIPTGHSKREVWLEIIKGNWGLRFACAVLCYHLWGREGYLVPQLLGKNHNSRTPWHQPPSNSLVPRVCIQTPGTGFWNRPAGKIVIHAQDLRILRSLGFEDS